MEQMNNPHYLKGGSGRSVSQVTFSSIYMLDHCKMLINSLHHKSILTFQGYNSYTDSYNDINNDVPSVTPIDLAVPLKVPGTYFIEKIETEFGNLIS